MTFRKKKTLKHINLKFLKSSKEKNNSKPSKKLKPKKESIFKN
jgi:hypothetical protein